MQLAPILENLENMTSAHSIWFPRLLWKNPESNQDFTRKIVNQTRTKIVGLKFEKVNDFKKSNPKKC